MVMVWSGYDDGIDFFDLVQHFAIIRKTLGIRMCFEGFRTPLLIYIAQGDDRFGCEILNIAGPLAPDANRGNVELVIR